MRPEMIIGRLDTADLVLNDPFVSRRHALVTVDAAGEVTIQDLNSTSGTFVNDERISGPRVLRSGDLVRFADLVTRFEQAEPVGGSGEAQTESFARELPTTTRVDTPVTAGRQDAGRDSGRDLEAEYERVRAVKKAARAKLLTMPGVHAVGVGPKVVNGERTDVPSIVVFLVEKKPLAELPADQIIPGEIDGVRTDVIEMDVPRLLSPPDPTQPPDPSRPRPVVGGVTLVLKDSEEFGTLGCFATTQDSPPKVVAITNHHIVAPVKGSEVSGVKIQQQSDPKSNPFTITFSIVGQNTTGSLIQVSLRSESQQKLYHAYWTATANDTEESIASNVAAAVRNINGAGVSADIGTNPKAVVITTPAGSDTLTYGCKIWDPPVIDSDVKLLADIAGNIITLSGNADGDYGIYTSWNTDGDDPTRGVFTPIKKNTDRSAIATAIAKSITDLINDLNNQHVNGITNISATPSAETVTINGVQQVSCLITGDIRVGQPTDSCFWSTCSLCCSDEIGRVLKADISLDTALVQLVRGLKYRNQIMGDSGANPPVGVTQVNGVHEISPQEMHTHPRVHKRGIIKPRYTTGYAATFDVGGYAGNSPANVAALPPNDRWNVFHRVYENVIFIIDIDSDHPFSDQGDSGAAVFDDSGKIVGILFGRGPTKYGVCSMMTPIDGIINGLGITITTAPGDQTVTDAQGVPAVVMRNEDQVIPQLLTAHAEITATPTGKKYAELVGRHAAEVQALVNNNLRVAVVWHRNSGPELLRALFRTVQSPDQRLPEEIDGMPVAERLARIRDVLMRYGSDELTEDLSRYSAELLRLTGLSYREALATMQTEDAR